ncbi:hypothetical protein BV375_02640 [Nostoc sp. 106C]|nr:hypothetical protein BV375_02640 [Nostoc sp. 106C]
MNMTRDKIVNSLGKKRLEATLAIATYAVGSGTASAAPTPGGEIPKQILLTAADVLMYTSIWKIYFEEDLSKKELVEILAELGLVTIAATGTAYVVSKVSTALLKEISNWTGPLGWGVVAAIAGSLSGLFGVAWAIYCDQLYSQRQPQPT